MRVNFFVATIIASVVISATHIVFNQILKGEPRFYRSIVGGIVTGIWIVGVLRWQNKKKAKADTSDSR